MGFERVPPPTPTRVESVSITVVKYVPFENGAEQAPGYAGSFAVRLTDENGVFADGVGGNLLPQLTPAQVASIKSFIDSMFAKAQAEAL